MAIDLRYLEVIGRHVPIGKDSEYGPACQRCGGDMDWECCSQCGGEGGHDAHELFPLEYAPGEITVCGLCWGSGGWWHCCNSFDWCLANPLEDAR